MWANFTLGCDTCGFYLDSQCALLPGMVRHRWNKKLLILSYPPYTYHLDKFYCQYCEKEINLEFWHYRFHEYEKWVHPKCIGNSGYLNIMFGDTIIDESHRHALKWVEYSKDDFACNCYQNKKFGAHLNLMHLPIEKSVALIYRFVNEMGLGGRNSTTSPEHSSHDHPLQLFEEQNNECNNYLTLLCDGCVQHVSAPFYSCTECNFFLHKYCAALPKEVQHPCNPGHMLVLRKIHYTSKHIRCGCCSTRTNGFVLSCDPCNLTLHVRCASLLNSVKAHDAHQHPLVPMSKLNHGPCNACGDDFNGLGFKCDTCRFRLDGYCAMLPRKVRHRGDKHDLNLSFPPYTYHREEFYCDFCEREINPNFWIYNCRDCDQSFHPRCTDPVQQIKNLKDENTLRVNNHPHFLKRVQQSLKCSICKKLSYADISFDCISCHFQLSYDCVTVSVP
ncbi:unnamed protein product [Ilex paraguariensis]|uniref:DC1 domain-containing protein n=1 Tax=Ilex paraguariensis TaxID=185542 RepID=A0ABC8RQU0_9AQUA